MGYAGYTVAKLPPPRPTDTEAAVQAVASLDALDVIHKLIYNCAVQPKEDKFRRLRLTNEKVQAQVVQCPGALDALLSLGWVADEAEPDFLVIPQGKFMTMAEVRVVDAAREKLKKKIAEDTKNKRL